MILRLSLNCNVNRGRSVNFACSRLRPNAGASVLGSSRGVFGRCHGELGYLTALPLGMQLSEKRNAPLTSGTCSEAIGQLARYPRAFPLHEVHQFALANSKAEAHMVIGIHESARRGGACHQRAIPAAGTMLFTLNEKKNSMYGASM